MGNHQKLLNFLRPDPAAVAACSPRSFSSSSASVSDDDGYSCSSYPTTDGDASPSRYGGSSTPPTPKSPWAHLPGLGAGGAVAEPGATGLIASLVKEDGHVYSLAATGDVLYTGTDSRNVRVWRDQRELAGFRTASGLVKAIVVADDGRIFTGHQDGKVRVWRADADNPAVHRQVGSLPKLKDYLKSAVNPTSYVETQRRGRQRAVWLRHSDAVSSLSLNEGAGLLYTASWDRTFKVWRLSDSKCLESVSAHDDAVNTVAAAGFESVVFTGSADGTVKVWRREMAPKGDATRHVLETVLRKGEGAVTAIAVSPEDRVVYVGSSDGLVTFWHWVDGEARYGGVLKGHRMAVMCLAVAGNVVVSGSADRTLCVWRRDGAEHVGLALLAGHTGPVKCVAMDEEAAAAGSGGDRRFVVYSGSLDGSVKVWRLADAEAEPATTVRVTERTAAAPAQPSQVWRGQPAPAAYAEAWAPCQTPELKRVRVAAA
ncbi:protein JINGUBANG [Aegilops tauschii subsp. strangulata]|nr:protein JINGUBANG [Aegilops tauschii subsp. strangulata]XP_044377628.1 protein JINGUBANG-like [Triticum aestivum]